MNGGGSKKVVLINFDASSDTGCAGKEWNEISGCMGEIWNGNIRDSGISQGCEML